MSTHLTVHLLLGLLATPLTLLAQVPTTQPPPDATAPAATGITPTTPPLADGEEVNPVRLDRLGQTVLSPRIRDITRVANTMPHYLTGIGLVTGLPRTGSSDRATRQAIINYIQRHGLNTPLNDVTSGSTALVSVTCKLPAFAPIGTRLDVQVEILTDALSLRGGTLKLAELKGVDGEVYVVAQGKLTVAGFTAEGQNASVQKNPNAVADLNNAGLVVRDQHSSYFNESGALELRLLNPSHFNARSVANGINNALAGIQANVQAVDEALVRIMLPNAQRTNSYALQILDTIGRVRVPVENPAKVVIDQVSGTVLAGEGVLISPCVVGVSELTIAIVEENYVSQPNAFANGETAVVGRTRVEAEQRSNELQALDGTGATVSDLLQNLRALGLKPEQLVNVFVALDRAGFLHAELEVL